MELDASKTEYVNAQLECSATDERAKLWASEVIGLEEKALRLRSNELKMERELENASSEIASYKKRLASLDKACQYLLQTIDALQEEKRLLQSKFRRASATGVTVDINKGHARRDASTSTNDLGHTTDVIESKKTLGSIRLIFTLIMVLMLLELMETTLRSLHPVCMRMKKMPMCCSFYTTDMLVLMILL